LSYIGSKPANKPLTSSDITDGIISTAKIADDAVTAAKAAFSAGKVLQVVSSDNSYATSTTSTSNTDVLSSSGVTWEAAITPSSTSSKIIISANLMAKSAASGIADIRSRLDILYKIGGGGYTSLSNNQMNSIYDYGGSGVNYQHRHSFQYLITPSTTSEIKIKFTCSSVNGSNTTEINPSGVSANSNCILYEVSAWL